MKGEKMSYGSEHDNLLHFQRNVSFFFYFILFYES